MTLTTPAVRRFGVFVLLLVALFARPLTELVVFAFHSELYSYILLVPAVSVVLVGRQRARLPALADPAPGLAVVPMLAGLLLLVWIAGPWGAGQLAGAESRLFAWTLAFILLLGAGVLFFLGGPVLRAVAFPFGFLLFAAPLPEPALAGLEMFFQRGSAAVAGVLFEISGLPVERRGLEFHLPTMILAVARECSGIRSTLVLFMAATLAGHLFLRRPWARVVLAVVVIPLGLLRNAGRIFSIAWLCVRLDPAWIDSWIHHRGGPLFFALSLIPFLGLLVLLRRAQRPGDSQRSTQAHV